MRRSSASVLLPSSEQQQHEDLQLQQQVLHNRRSSSLQAPLIRSQAPHHQQQWHHQHQYHWQQPQQQQYHWQQQQWELQHQLWKQQPSSLSLPSQQPTAVGEAAAAPATAAAAAPYVLNSSNSGATLQPKQLLTLPWQQSRIATAPEVSAPLLTAGTAVAATPAPAAATKPCPITWDEQLLQQLWGSAAYSAQQLDYIAAIFNRLLAVDQLLRPSPLAAAAGTPTAAAVVAAAAAATAPRTATISAAELGMFWGAYAAMADAPYCCCSGSTKIITSSSSSSSKCCLERLGLVAAGGRGRVDLPLFTRLVALLDCQTPAAAAAQLRLRMIFAYFADDSRSVYQQHQRQHQGISRRRVPVWTENSYGAFRAAMCNSKAVDR